MGYGLLPAGRQDVCDIRASVRSESLYPARQSGAEGIRLPAAVRMAHGAVDDIRPARLMLLQRRHTLHICRMRFDRTAGGKGKQQVACGHRGDTVAATRRAGIYSHGIGRSRHTASRSRLGRTLRRYDPRTDRRLGVGCGRRRHPPRTALQFPLGDRARAHDADAVSVHRRHPSGSPTAVLRRGRNLSIWRRIHGRLDRQLS